MAKKATEQPFADVAPGFVDDFQGPPPVVSPVDMEKEGLRLRVVELERLLAERAERTGAPVAELPPGEPGYWRVSLKYGLTRIVRASDEANAWNTYCETMGVLGSEFRPVVALATEAEWDKQEELRRAGRL